MVQELIEAEASAHIGAEWNERTPSRTNIRNGHRDKVLTTLAGDLDLEIPKVRTGSFFPSLLERRRRIDQALYAVIMEAYVHGVSTRSVDDLVKALGGDSGISKSELSRICAALDEPLTAFRTLPLDHVRFPYVYLDATHCKARVNHQIVSRAVVVATGGTPGRRLGEHHRRRRPRGPGPWGSPARAKPRVGRSETARARRSGRSSCARCESAACPGSA
jgi:putative transposase